MSYADRAPVSIQFAMASDLDHMSVEDELLNLYYNLQEYASAHGHPLMQRCSFPAWCSFAWNAMGVPADKYIDGADERHETVPIAVPDFEAAQEELRQLPMQDGLQHVVHHALSLTMQCPNPYVHSLVACNVHEFAEWLREEPMS